MILKYDSNKRDGKSITIKKWRFVKKAILAYINVPSGTHLKTSRILKIPLQEKSINSSRFEASTSSYGTLLCIMDSPAALLENSDADFEAPAYNQQRLTALLVSVVANALATKHS